MQTPDNKTVPSSFAEGGQFVLALSLPILGGEYTKGGFRGRELSVGEVIGEFFLYAEVV